MGEWGLPMPTLIEDICAYGGCDNLGDALVNWQAEREGMQELHDMNTALKIGNRRMRLIIELVEKAFDMIVLEGGMFLPVKLLGQIDKISKQIEADEKHRSYNKYLCDL